AAGGQPRHPGRGQPRAAHFEGEGEPQDRRRRGAGHGTSGRHPGPGRALLRHVVQVDPGRPGGRRAAAADAGGGAAGGADGEVRAAGQAAGDMMEASMADLAVSDFAGHGPISTLPRDGQTYVGHDQNGNIALVWWDRGRLLTDGALAPGNVIWWSRP